MEPDISAAFVQAQLETMAAERDRIAGEIHDDPVQALTAVSLQLQRLAYRLEDDTNQALVRDALEVTNGALERLRHLLFVLHPTTLEEDGLVATLRLYGDEYVEPEGTVLTVDGDADLALQLGVAALAFRLAREAVTNALRHANPRHIDIRVILSEGGLQVTVSDDGSGFVTTNRAKTGHRGMSHALALARIALGDYQVLSSPEGGTIVTITLPVPVE